jgi:hypothetical protein
VSTHETILAAISRFIENAADYPFTTLLRRQAMSSKISPKTSVLFFLILGTLVHAASSDLHNPEDPTELMKVFGTLRLIETATRMMRTVLTVVNVLEKTAARVRHFRTGMKARNTTNYKCLCVPRALHL